MKFQFGAICCLLAVSLISFPAPSGGKKNLIVTLKNGYSPENVHGKYRTRTVRWIRNSNTYLIETPDTADNTIPRLRKEAAVASVEEDSVFTLESAPVPTSVLSLADSVMALLGDAP